MGLGGGGGIRVAIAMSSSLVRLGERHGKHTGYGRCKMRWEHAASSSGHGKRKQLAQGCGTWGGGLEEVLAGLVAALRLSQLSLSLVEILLLLLLLLVVVVILRGAGRRRAARALIRCPEHRGKRLLDVRRPQMMMVRSVMWARLRGCRRRRRRGNRPSRIAFGQGHVCRRDMARAAQAQLGSV